MNDAAMTPAIDGWFRGGEHPALLGSRCTSCSTIAFPATTGHCRNPACDSGDHDEIELSRRGRLWSWTDARYQPPPPYIPRTDPYEPFTLAAVELPEGVVVLGQLVGDGGDVDELAVGTVVEVVEAELYRSDEGDVRSMWGWSLVDDGGASDVTGERVLSEEVRSYRHDGTETSQMGTPSGSVIADRTTSATHSPQGMQPPGTGGGDGAAGGVPGDDLAAGAGAPGSEVSGQGASRRARRGVSDGVVVAGVGMHPWGKWGRSFVEYGVAAAREALADAGVTWTDVDLCVGGETVRNGYPGYVAGATFAQALGWNGARVATSYAACATGAQAIDTARARILAGLCDVALVVGADTTPKGFLAPNAGERPDDADWLRFRLLGATNPSYFGLYARRRMELFGATPEDFARVKVKNARHGLANPNARYRKEVAVEDVLGSPIVSDPLHLLDICATSDGGAAVVLTSAEFARERGLDSPVKLAAVSTVTPAYPKTIVDLPDIATDSTVAVEPPALGFRASIAAAAYEEAGVGPEDLSLAEVYDLSTALELDWYEDIGLCGPGEAEHLVRSGATTVGGRVPVNPSGGLACFGEAVPAQALAQVCEMAWQLRGRADDRQVEDARVALSVNQGLFGHGSAVILTR